jgi:hypothetical protein
MKHYRFTRTGNKMTDDDRITLINDTTTIDNLTNAHQRAINHSHDIRPTYSNYPLGDSDITATDWQQHWAESDRMFDSMWHGT